MVGCRLAHKLNEKIWKVFRWWVSSPHLCSSEDMLGSSGICHPFLHGLLAWWLENSIHKAKSPNKPSEWWRWGRRWRWLIHQVGLAALTASIRTSTGHGIGLSSPFEREMCSGIQRYCMDMHGFLKVPEFLFILNHEIGRRWETYINSREISRVKSVCPGQFPASE